MGLSVAFAAPAKPARTGIGIPLVSLTPTIETTGGALHGSQTLYYAISGLDDQGSEGALSFALRAEVPAGTDTNTVTLTNLSFSAGAASFNVYRGETPSQMIRIANQVAIAATYRDEGDPVDSVVSPPDENYDHANFYWRFELQPEVEADAFSANTIAKTILDKAHPGAIVIGHANGRGKHTAEALALAIPKLKEEGYSFVTVSELLAAGTPVITASCAPARPIAKSRLSRVSHAQRHDLLGLPGALAVEDAGSVLRAAGVVGGPQDMAGRGGGRARVAAGPRFGAWLPQPLA